VLRRRVGGVGQLAVELMDTRAPLAMLVKTWPKLSETFILEEVLGLQRAGVPLRLYALEPSHRRDRSMAGGGAGARAAGARAAAGAAPRGALPRAPPAPGAAAHR
jgi:hypothetical protein